MDFELTDDQLELRDTARAVLASACPLSLVRGVFEGTADADGLWKQLVDLDWPALAMPEAHGGIGLGFVELAVVVEELGRVVAPGPFLATVTQLVPLVRATGSGDRFLSAVAAGELTGAAALVGDGVTARPSRDGHVLDGTATHVLDGATADEVAVVVQSADGGGVGVVVVPGGAAGVAERDVIDPTFPLADLTFDGVEVDADRVLLEPGDARGADAVQRALDEATIALALSTVSTCRAIFERTLEYAKDREQFGRPIGSFQAIKHRLADCYLAVERASALAYFAALTVAEDDERRTLAASMAKAAAGDCERLLAQDGLQLHGGIGFTWENDLHFFLKRAKTGGALLGTAAFHRARVASLLGLSA